jgi:hypothetical protein
MKPSWPPISNPPASVSWVLGLQVCTTMPSFQSFKYNDFSFLGLWQLYRREDCLPDLTVPSLRQQTAHTVFAMREAPWEPSHPGCLLRGTSILFMASSVGWNKTGGTGSQESGVDFRRLSLRHCHRLPVWSWWLGSEFPYLLLPPDDKNPGSAQHSEKFYLFQSSWQYSQ